MSRCPGLHCSGCSGNGGGGLAAVLVALVVLGVAIRAAWHAIVTALEITAYVVCGSAGLAVVLGTTYAALRIRARVARSGPRQTIQARAEVIRLGTMQEQQVIDAAATPNTWITEEAGNAKSLRTN